MDKFMQKAEENAENGIENNEGGPFGAVIVNKEGKIISNGNNRVLIDNDPTMHAEIVAIRRACEKLKTYDLTGYTLYTLCEPCPMCLSAIIWSNIKDVYYGCSREDAEEIGFRDNDIYKYLKGENKELIKLKQIDSKKSKKAFKKYVEKNGKIY